MHVKNISKHSDDILITDEESGYSLRLLTETSPSDISTRFESPTGELITGRSMNRYTELLPSLPLKADLRYIEVGAGVGALVPYLVREFSGGLSTSPVVIDPVDYSKLEKILRFAIQQDCKLVEERRLLLSEFLDRLCIFQDINVVEHVQLTLASAIEERLDLRASADVVIDMFGAPYEVEAKKGLQPHQISMLIQDCRAMEQALLKQGGILLQNQ